MYWMKRIPFKDNEGYLEFYVRCGKWMACDDVGVIKDRVYILPCISFFFNHSQIFIDFAWLTLTADIWYNSWRRYDAYRDRMLRKRMHITAEYGVGDKIEIIPLGKVYTIKAVTDKYYDLGYSEDGVKVIADLRYPEQYRLYKPSWKHRIKSLFTK